MVTILFPLLLILFLYLIHLLIERLKFVKMCSKLPSLKTSKPILGDIPVLVGRANEKGLDFHVLFLQSLMGIATIFHKEGLFCTWLSFNPMVCVFSSKTVEPIVNSNTLITKSKFYSLCQSWLKTGLITSTGEKWRKRRKLITPTFHYKVLDDFIPSFDKNSRTLVKKLQKYDGEEWVSIVPVLTLCALDIIIETAMGVELNAQEGESSAYVHAIEEFAKIAVERMVKFWLQNDFILSLTSKGKSLQKAVQVLHEFTSNVIKKKKQELIKQKGADTQENINLQEEEYGNKKKPLLDLLLEQQLQDNSLTDEDIAEEVDTFVFAGHDTTAFGISWVLFHLGLHPEIQEKLYEEMYEIFGNDKEREITAEDLRRMKYLECVLKESQRVMPSVPILQRVASHDVVINGYTVPRGATIAIFLYALHRDPDVFPNPEIFNPERFLPENCVGRSPFAYIPFSAGPRNCIGQKYAMLEMKTIVGNIIRNFVVETIDKPDNIHTTALAVLKPKEELRLRITRRL